MIENVTPENILRLGLGFGASKALLMSLNMLIETPGGFDYIAADCESWMNDADFAETRAHHLGGPDTMVVGIK